VGLFQINLLAHNCPEYFSFTWTPPSCQLKDGYTVNDVNACTEPLLNADININKAFDISGAGSNWGPWATAKPEYCGVL
jgi:hypothetical protein